MLKRHPIKLKYVADYIFRGDAPKYVENDGIRVISQGCVQSSGLNISKSKLHDKNDVERISGWLTKGDVLINSTGTGTLGRVSYVENDPKEPMFADGHVTIIRDSKERFCPKFLFYYLSILQEPITVNCSEGATNQIELSRPKLGSMLIEWPAIEEQEFIANFLGHETNRLDALIAEKQKLIELLAEKRHTLIMSAVMRGVKATVRLKESGIPWLGKIPEHWPLFRAKYLWQECSLPVRSNDEMVTCFRDGQVTLRKNRREDGFTNAVKELGYKGVRAGQLVLHSMDAFAGAIGVSDSEGKCTPEYIICDPVKENVYNPYFGYLLRAMAINGFIQATCTAVRERAPRIHFSDFGDMFFPVPPLEEQLDIVVYIAVETAKLDELRAATEKTIGLLKERRTALIAAAVTGKMEIGGANAS